jgi:hypothetical protein
MAFEPIHVVLEFWDRPRSGIAEFDGRAHYFECEFDQAADDYADTHVLRPVDDETISLARQWDQISNDWWAAFRRGEVSESTRPSIPGQNAGYAALDATIKRRISNLPPPVARARARFRIEQGITEIEWEAVT